nr:hypothetical protein [Tanacetum cinerariifolium]
FIKDNEEDYDIDDETNNGDSKRENLGVKSGLIFEEESDTKVVPETMFEQNIHKPNMKENFGGQKDTQSTDPFNIYDLLKKKKDDSKHDTNVEESLKFSSGFTPSGANEEQVNKNDESNKERGEEVDSCRKRHCSKKNSKEHAAKSVRSGSFKKSEIPSLGGSMLQLMDDLVNVGQTMGYNIEGCMKNMEEIIESQGANTVIRGVWVHNGNNFLIISDYAPQDLNEKKMLWDYLVFVIANWKGMVVIMGDFNKVRMKEERFGSVFNIHGADTFNLFISNTGLEEVPLAITLDRYLSDHRPILLQDGWNAAPVDESNAMNNLMTKLKYLKQKIRVWNNKKKMSARSSRISFKTDLNELDAIIDKDENSKYYHSILKKKRNQLNIRGVLVDGKWIHDPCMVKGEFLSHFKNRFDKPVENRIQINMNFPHTLYFNQRTDLEIDVTKEDIKRAVWDCGVDKSSGPDGFTFGFYCRFWKVIKNDVTDAVTWFFHHGSFPKGGNTSFIALIPKTLDANMVKDFRPISLIESLYKIIAKILANRLVGVLRDIFSEVQSAFVAEGQILDGTFILNEIFQWFFKGLKQGDPLSPYLFILVMESLHISFQRVVDAGIFKGIELGPSFQLSHMFYADDAVFVGQWSDFNIDIIVHVLDCFYRASRMRINMSKIKIIGIFMEDHKVDYAASKIGCPILKTPFSYLGSKVGGLCLAFNLGMRLWIGGAEQEQFDALRAKVEGVSLVNMKDRWSWSLEVQGNFQSPR